MGTTEMTRMKPYRFPQRQRGSVLFVAIVMLIVLGLLAVHGMQGTTMQERMAGNYRLLNLAFQNTEGRVRARERAIANAFSTGGAPTSIDESSCGELDRVGWASSQSAAATYTARITRCIPGSSVSVRGPINNSLDIYSITTVDTDIGTGTGTPTSTVAIETVFIP